MHAAARSNRTGANREVPSSVNRVLGSAGEPLAESVRRKLEPRFEHDFSTVRVHSDRDAAQSSADLHARAWTAGNHIAFAPRMYEPQTPRGLHLLAHELAHVAQQSSSPRTSSLMLGTPHDASEVEADRAASAVSRGENASVRAQDGAVVHRQEIPQFYDEPAPDDPWPEKTRAAGIRATMPQYLEWRGTHPAHFPLSKEEIAAAESATGTTAPTTAASGAGLEPQFVLHDTDASMGISHITSLTGTGPKGTGVKSWVPKTTDPIDTRPGGFFESKRPTATGFEKGEDIIGEGLREANFHKIWKATAKSEQDAALDRAVAGTGLTPDQITELKPATATFLQTGSKPTVDGVKTTAGWAVTEICQRVTSAGAEAIADPGKKTVAAKTLTDTCGDQLMTKWFASRNRVAQRTNVEIVQVGGGAPLPNPPYTDKQYEGVAKIYLQAALAARRWPFITTHRYEDRDVAGGHQDPRCFNVTRLYSSIATKMSHPAATIYGLVPRYGASADKSANVTWTKTMCHADKPA